MKLEIYLDRLWCCKTIKYITVCAFTLLLTDSCTKLIEVSLPSDQIVGQNIYNDPNSAPKILTGIYYDMSISGFPTGGSSITALTGLSADELTPFNLSEGLNTRLYENNLTATTYSPPSWKELYGYISRVNAAISGFSTSTSLVDSIKFQLLGEAKFLRAFYYFYLINLYGDVPLILTTDYKITGTASRTPKDLVFQQILKDLIEAENLLSESYLTANVLNTTTERIRPNKASAKASLARVYLYIKEWDKAETKATEVIENSKYSLVNDLNSVFLKNSMEAIWQLQPSDPGYNTKDGAYFIVVNGLTPTVTLSTSLLSAFETGDNRKNNWISSIMIGNSTYYYPYKYKVSIGSNLTEYLTVFRLAEQYLIRAEAKIQQGKISEGIQDLNILRTRARASISADIPNPLPPLPATLTKEEALLATEHERQVELFCEWGNRWFDLKRLGKANTTLAPLKGNNWQLTDQLYPLPQEDINLNPSLVGKQNPGY